MFYKIPLLWLCFLAAAGPAALPAAPVLPLTVLNELPHEAGHYSQGLFFHRSVLYESAGLYGRSSLSSWRLPAGRPPELKQKRRLAERFFAEGADLAEGEIYLLTWRENTALVFDPESLELKRELAYAGEGWGLAWDGERFWRSDGSARLYPHRAGDFSPAGEPLTVRDGRRETSFLNELEWDPLRGLLLANVYGQDLVAVIEPGRGRVLAWLDARPLRVLALAAGLENGGRPLDTALNGLALAPSGLWLTGKFWPRLYQVAWPPEGLEALIESGG
ncbi:MAG: glutaminyl-peptide cyclotransferase [Candidatus Adiutrix sp.]|jgi:glutamine cyclotransferase|nr:glutaminyl-peptide cyclotransferase [Candidatus Adiutrix sp.]